MQDMEQIYEKYMPQVYKYLFSLCHDTHLTEELTQETFFQAMKSIDSFRGDCKLYVWLCQIARNLWCRELRKKSKEKRSELTEEIPDAGPEPERSAIEKIEVLELYKLLHALEEPLREVMYLRLTGNFSFKEIGEILDKDENWARVTFYRGKQRIRKESRHEV
ncbi:RNA polymerase sigma factor [Ruminococcus gauvreauii]|uniref:Sigma-70 family RNA polymerase sigma factor n=1 Tax=Ruminococcus gauvreauii TaxID=438033 RepID=A0ABY5VFZ1_9FIRM|nr:sigma-70 family RNA polymerase sigma factor [Ruminococcus gauvreauii]UWP58851.1 sigma-70 family RNA polymerase sigma factor [Ruminococcus gauvreauii]